MKMTYTAMVLASAAIAYAQAPGSRPPFIGPGGHDFLKFMGAEGGHPGQVVKGAPFSGKELTNETQTLADGTHITHTITAQFYRDNDGRTRTERTFSGMGPWSGGTPKTMITIFDPVAGVGYFLNPDKQTATKFTLPSTQNATGAKIMPPRVTAPFSETVTTTDLGTQTIDGLPCKGTRTTRVIPINTIGNDQPITITDERWYSADLQLNLQTKHVDPRMGEADFSFENISRTNPDESLFAPPANYTVTTKDRPDGGFDHPGPPPPPQ